MEIIKKTKKRKSVTRDGKKEHIFRQLSTILDQAGYEVRREKLRQGFGWRVASGDCRAEESRYVFVDRRLSQDEQISFLVSKIRDFKIDPKESIQENLPDTIKRQLVNEHAN